MKLTYREKNLLDYFFGGFRSTLNVNMYAHNPAHRAILIYYYTYTHLPPSSRTLLLVSKHTYMCQYILLLLL